MREAPLAGARVREAGSSKAVRPEGRTAHGSGGAHLAGARALGALLDVELDPLAAREAIEIERGIQAVAMEEVFLRVLCGDEAEAAIGNDLLDGTGGHHDLQHFPNKVGKTRPVRKGLTTRSIDASCGEGPP